MTLITILHLVLKLRMSGVILLLPLNAFKAWRGKALLLALHNLDCKTLV